MHTLFVYGTLKRGYGNHPLIAGALPLGEDAVPGVLYAQGAPIAVRAEGEGWVEGELYDVTPEQLAECDRLEGHPRAYRRERVTTRRGRWAEVYYWQHAPAPGAEPLPNGRWPR